MTTRMGLSGGSCRLKMLRFPLPREGGIEDELISAYSADFPQTVILSNRKVGPIIKLPRGDYNFDNNNFTILFHFDGLHFDLQTRKSAKIRSIQ